MEWKFMTLMSWGEQPMGTWTLQVETIDSTTGTALQPLYTSNI